jgi:transposase InsO family protein
MESFFRSLKAELIHGERFESEEALRQALACYVHYYNHARLHSALADRSPVDYATHAA